MKLHEIHDKSNEEEKLNKIKDWIYGWERNPEGRKRWEKFQGDSDIELDGSGKIICHRSLNFSCDAMTSGGRLDEIEYPFSRIDGSFDVTNCDLDSFKNFPSMITHDLFIGGNRIKNFEHAPKIIGGGFSIGNQMDSSMTSLKDIHKHIESVNGYITVGGHIKSNILGLILLGPKGVKASINARTALKPSKDLDEALKIINKHLKDGRAGVLAAQQELIDNDLDDYAEL